MISRLHIGNGGVELGVIADIDRARGCRENRVRAVEIWVPGMCGDRCQRKQDQAKEYYFSTLGHHGSSRLEDSGGPSSWFPLTNHVAGVWSAITQDIQKGRALRAALIPLTLALLCVRTELYFYISDITSTYVSAWKAAIMPRRRRIEVPGELHHVMARGLDGMDIFRSDKDRNHFLHLLGKYLQMFDIRCYAWALMPNHYHFLVRPPGRDLGIMMRRLNGSYARYFNKTCGRRGYVFMDRYKSVATQDLMYFRELIRYIHLNPMRARVVKKLTSLASYRWSSHRDYLGQPRHSWCLAGEGLRRFGRNRSDALRAYQQFIGEGIDINHEETGFVAGDSRADDERVSGDPQFVRKALEQDRSARARRAALRARGVDIQSVALKVSSYYKVEPQALKNAGRHNARSQARAVMCCLCRTELGSTLREIGEFLDLTETGVALAARRGADHTRQHPLNIKI
ncbi:MAG: hypothetical protein GF418_04985 [Chitinivibrionales bacterium]|nr:hypothetical protein [Chitinivibrionales bacterium]MBD3394964.1 hypothetical protein [Chitinivibrionales bacterium]